MNRDEFKVKIKETVAQRAAYMCSNPDCRKITIGPHSNPDKSLSNGIAAHICAAAKGGPRTMQIKHNWNVRVLVMRYGYVTAVAILLIKMK